MNLGLTSLRGKLPSNHERRFIWGGAMGTAQTISRMQELVSQGKREFDWRPVIGKIIAPCPPKDYYCYAKAIYEFCRDRIKYVFDPVGIELIESPMQILRAGIADCDSICILQATMFEQIGMPAAYVTIKADRQRPDEYSHVYCRVNIPKRGWVAADATMPKMQFGWEPPDTFPKKVWNASKDPPEAPLDDGMDARPKTNTSGMGKFMRDYMTYRDAMGARPWGKIGAIDLKSSEVDPFDLRARAATIDRMYTHAQEMGITVPMVVVELRDMAQDVVNQTGVPDNAKSQHLAILENRWNANMATDYQVPVGPGIDWSQQNGTGPTPNPTPEPEKIPTWAFVAVGVGLFALGFMGKQK